MPSARTPIDSAISARRTRECVRESRERRLAVFFRVSLALFLQTERLDDAGDALLILADELRVVIAAEVPALPAELLERLLPCRRLGGGLDELDQAIALLRREARGAEDAAPVAELDVDLLLLERGNALELLRRRLRERAHLAGLDLLGELAQARHARGDVAAEDRGDRLAAALERHVVDLRRLDADVLGDEPDQDVVGAAGRAAAPGHLAGVVLERPDEVGHRLVRRVR